MSKEIAIAGDYNLRIQALNELYPEIREHTVDNRGFICAKYKGQERLCLFFKKEHLKYLVEFHEIFGTHFNIALKPNIGLRVLSLFMEEIPTLDDIAKVKLELRNPNSVMTPNIFSIHR